MSDHTIPGDRDDPLTLHRQWLDDQRQGEKRLIETSRRLLGRDPETGAWTVNGNPHDPLAFVRRTVGFAP